jgi:hypothetical protein
MYFVSIYENRMKPVEIILRKEEEGKKENNEWSKSN